MKQKIAILVIASAVILIFVNPSGNIMRTQYLQKRRIETENIVSEVNRTGTRNPFKKVTAASIDLKVNIVYARTSSQMCLSAIGKVWVWPDPGNPGNYYIDTFLKPEGIITIV